MAVNVPLRPSATLPDVAQAMIDFMPLVQGKLAVVQSFSIGTSETPVAHGLGVVPLAALAMPHSNVTYWRTRAPDARCVYLAASSAAVCDVVVVA